MSDYQKPWKKWQYSHLKVQGVNMERCMLIHSWLKNAPHQGIGGVSICDFPHFGARNPTKVKNNFYSIMDLRLFWTQDLDSLPQNK